MMTPELEVDIRARAGHLYNTEPDPNEALSAYLDRHILLREVDALRAVAVFLCEHCGEPDVAPDESGLNRHAIMILAGIALQIQQRQQAEEAARKAAEPQPLVLEPDALPAIEEPPCFQISGMEEAPP